MRRVERRGERVGERRCVAVVTGCVAPSAWVCSAVGGEGRDAEYFVSLKGASRSRTCNLSLALSNRRRASEVNSFPER